MKSRWFSLGVAALTVTDQAAKCYAENKLDLNEEKEMTDKIVVRHVHNKGACLSLLEDEPEAVTVLSTLSAGLVLSWQIITLTKKGQFLKKLGLSLMSAGAISNTFDRFVRGYVVDYIGVRCKNKELSGITYNLADFFLAAGAVIVVITTTIQSVIKAIKKKAIRN